MCKKLSVGYMSHWEDVARNAEKGILRTYDALRALKSGLQHQEALRALQQLYDHNAQHVEYDGIRLAKK